MVAMNSPEGNGVALPPAKVWLLAANHISVLGQLHCSTANLLHFQPPWPLFYNMWIQIHWLDPGPEFWLNLDPDLVSWVSRWWIYVIILHLCPIIIPIFTSCLDPDLYSEYGSRSTQLKKPDPIWIRIHFTDNDTVNRFVLSVTH